MDYFFRIKFLAFVLAFTNACQDVDRVNYELLEEAEKCVQSKHMDISPFQEVQQRFGMNLDGCSVANVVESIDEGILLLEGKIGLIEECRSGLDSSTIMEFDRRGYYRHMHRIRQQLILMQVSKERILSNPLIAEALVDVIKSTAVDLEKEDADFWASLDQTGSTQ